MAVLQIDPMTIRSIASSCALFACASVLLATLAATFKAARRRSTKAFDIPGGVTLPPGPKPLPILGNLLDIPRHTEWETLTKWGQQYGDVVLVQIFGRNLIFLSSVKAARDLFEKRSLIYSDRPRFPLLNDLMGLEWNFGFYPYNDAYRRHRKVFMSKLGVQKVTAYVPLQEMCVNQLLKGLLVTPDNYRDHYRLCTTRLIIMSMYGIFVDTRDHRLVRAAEDVMHAVSDAGRVGAWLVDRFPIFKHVPSFCSEPFYKKDAKHWRGRIDTFLNEPFNKVKSLMTEYHPGSCFVADLLEEREEPNIEEEHIIRNCAGAAYGAGSDTTNSSISAFTFAMLNNPEVQRKAQAELDTIVGQDRLPSLADREKLPYVTAIMKETLRWHTVTPQAIPHEANKDDIYKGLFIPKGSTVILNVWGIMHDPEIYPDPLAFNPERFLSADGQLDCADIDPERFAFGFGRRSCPGVHFAVNSLWLAIAQVLATMHISHKLDERGRPIETKWGATSGIICHPKPFKCSIVPRSEQTRYLIETL